MRLQSVLRGNYRSVRSFPRVRRPHNAFAMTIMLLPLTGLVGAGIVAFTQRVVTPFLDNTPAEYVSKEVAIQQAEMVAARLLNTTVTVTDASQTSGYSQWRKNPLLIWYITCKSGADSYLVRVNGLTGQTYGFNRISIAGVPDGTNRASSLESAGAVENVTGDTAPMTSNDLRLRTEASARRSLRGFGIAPQRLVLTKSSHSWNDAGDRCIVYFFNRRILRLGDRLLTVTINERTGGLEQLWNASGGL